MLNSDWLKTKLRLIVQDLRLIVTFMQRAYGLKDAHLPPCARVTWQRQIEVFFFLISLIYHEASCKHHVLTRTGTVFVTR